MIPYTLLIAVIISYVDIYLAIPLFIISAFVPSYILRVSTFPPYIGESNRTYWPESFIDIGDLEIQLPTSKSKYNFYKIMFALEIIVLLSHHLGVIFSLQYILPWNNDISLTVLGFLYLAYINHMDKYIFRKTLSSLQHKMWTEWIYKLELRE